MPDPRIRQRFVKYDDDHDPTPAPLASVRPAWVPEHLEGESPTDYHRRYLDARFAAWQRHEVGTPVPDSRPTTRRDMFGVEQWTDPGKKFG